MHNVTQIAGGTLTTLEGPAQVNMHQSNVYIGKHMLTGDYIHLNIPKGKTLAVARQANIFMCMVEGQPFPSVQLETDVCIQGKALPINIYGMTGQIELGGINFNSKAGDVMTITQNGVDISNGSVSTFNMPFGSVL